MSYAQSLIDRTKDFLPKKTDYAFNKAVGITYSNLKMIRDGKSFFGPKQRVRIHEITKIPMEEITAMLEMDRAKKDEDKAFWSARLPRISAACFIALSLLAAHYKGNSGIDAHSAMLFLLPDLYIMRSVFIIGTLLALPILIAFLRTAAQQRFTAVT
jgi:hypothetical protein